MPRVSVIIPSYNHGKYVAMAIQSVLDQTFQDFEIVITDDGSTDNTVEEIKKFKDERIRLYTFEKNRGAAFASTNCINQSKGEYLAMLSSDDAFLPEKLDKQVKFLDEHPEVWAVFSYARIIDENGSDFTDKNHFYYNIFNQPNLTRYEWLNHFFYKGNCLCHPSVLARRSVYIDIAPRNTRFAQLGDFYGWVKVCLKYDIHIIPERLVKFRVRAGEANASGGRLENIQRFQFESVQVLESFTEIDSVKDLLKIFPTAIDYWKNFEKEHIPFYIAMIALKMDSGATLHHYFGISALYKLLGNKSTSEKLEKTYGFRHRDFIKLSGAYDFFNIIQLAEKDGQLAEKDGQLAEKDGQLAEKDGQLAEKDGQLAILNKNIGELASTLEDIYQSNVWKLSAPLRWYGSHRRLALMFVKAFPSQLSKSGGVVPLIRSLLRVWRCEGMAGVRRAVNQGLTELSNTSELIPHTPASQPEPTERTDTAQPEILFVSHEASRTGAPVFLLSLIREIKSRLGVSCYILLCSGGELEDQFRELGTTEILSSRNALPPLVLQRLIRRNIQLIYSNTITNGLIQKELAKLGCPILCHVHELAYSIANYFGEENLRHILETTDIYLAGSRAVADYLTDQLKLPKEKVFLAYPFVAMDPSRQRLQSMPADFNLPENAIVIGACGMISWRKGTDLFIQLAKKVLTCTSRPVVFVWLGGPITHGDISSLRYDAAMLGIDKHLILTGKVDVYLPYLSRFDIFVLPSREDPFPLVVLDAASMGIPIVCFDKAGGASELVEGDAGMVVPYLDVQAMGDAVCKLVEDADLRKRLGERARQKAYERYDASVGIHVILNIIVKLMERPSKGKNEVSS